MYIRIHTCTCTLGIWSYPSTVAFCVYDNISGYVGERERERERESEAFADMYILTVFHICPILPNILGRSCIVLCQIERIKDRIIFFLLLLSSHSYLWSYVAVD